MRSITALLIVCILAAMVTYLHVVASSLVILFLFSYEKVRSMKYWNIYRLSCYSVSCSFLFFFFLWERFAFACVHHIVWRLVVSFLWCHISHQFTRKSANFQLVCIKLRKSKNFGLISILLVDCTIWSNCTWKYVHERKSFIGKKHIQKKKLAKKHIVPLREK